MHRITLSGNCEKWQSSWIHKEIIDILGFLFIIRHPYSHQYKRVIFIINWSEYPDEVILIQFKTFEILYLQGGTKHIKCSHVKAEFYKQSTLNSEPPSSASQAAVIGGGVGGSVVAVAVVIGVIVFITIRYHTCLYIL